MTTVKITELTDIGANLATSTVVPVVNMAGTPTTQKTNIGNIANIILEGAGVDYPEASVALIAQTVSNAAQPNITSTGTLTTLAVSGNASVNGNLTSNGTAYLGNISTTGSATITTLIVGTTANLGAVGNVKITGGTSGQILSTDGAGNLSWVSDANGGSYGNSDVATYLASYGSNTITTTGNVSVGNIIGNGQALTGLAGANVTGFVPNANIANTAFAVAAANVSGLGNIATINLTGSTSNVLYGNGVFAPITGGGGNYGDSNVVSLLSAFGSNTITTTGNVSVGNISTNGTLKIGNATITEVNPIVLGFTDDIYVDGDVLSQRLKSNTGTVALNASNSTANTEWAFNVGGTLNLPQPKGNISTSIQSIYGNTSSFIDFVSNNSANFTFGTTANHNIVLITGLNENDNRWVLGYDGTITFPTLTVDIHNGGNQQAQTLQFGDPTQQAIITGPTPSANVNAQRLIIQGQRGTGGEGGDVYVWGGDSDVNGGDIKIYAGDNDGITGPGGYVNIDGGAGPDSGGYITLNGGYSSNGDGGYINIYGGQGGNGIGGNINVQAGQSTGSGVDGANILLQGGYSQTANGGAVTVRGGQSALGLSGYGNVLVEAGASQWKFANDGLLSLPGDNVKIGSQYGSEAILASNVAFGVVSQGSAGMTALQWTDDVSNTSQFSAVYINDVSANVGDIQIRTGAVGNANIWRFGNDGNLTLPSNTFAVNYANGTPVSIGGGGNTGNVTFDNVTVQGVNGLNLSAGSDFTANLAYLQVRAGDVASHIHLDTGNNEAYDQYFGNDSKFVKLGLGIAGNVSIGTYQDGGVGQFEWTFDSNGNLILAGGNSVIQSIANSSLDILNPNVSTMVLTPDPGYSSQALVLDPTSVGHIHLRSPGSNIDQPSANLFLGGEASSFEVGQYNGAVPNLFIHSNNYTWTFDIDGNLTLPQLTTISDESGIGTTLTVGVPPTVIVISGADFSAVNTTYTKTSATTPTWEPAGYNPATDPYIEFSGGEYGIFVPGFGQAIYVNTGTLNKPLTQWNTNPPLGSVAPTAVYTYGASGPDWVFGADGKLTFPGTPRIDTVTNNFEVQAAEAINFEANTVVNIYTDTGNNAFQWQFGDDGVLTVPGNLVAVTASPAPTISGFSSVSALVLTTPVVPYANLPLATIAGQRAFINDANLAPVGNFGEIVGNGGSNTVCVWSDGTDWRIG